MDRHDWLDVLIVLLMAGALVVSVHSCEQSGKANTLSEDATRIAKEANDIAYEYYVPSIKTMQVLQYDNDIRNQSGEIDIYNAGGRVIDFNPSLHTVAEISYSNYQKSTPIMVYGYYESAGEKTIYSEGLLWKYKIKDGYAKFDKVRIDFNNYASNNFSDASLSLKIIMQANYKDFRKKIYSESYNVLDNKLMSEQDANRILNEARTNYDLARNRGVSMALYDLNGESLFKLWSINFKN